MRKNWEPATTSSIAARDTAGGCILKLQRTWPGLWNLGLCTWLRQPQAVVFLGMTEDYPRTLLELEQRFRDAADCRASLFSLRWPQGFLCPICSASGLAIRRELWRCVQCGRETSVLAGTIFQDSKLPLAVWFRAMWQEAARKNGVSALGLQRVLGLGNYRTAWSLLHKLRRAMIRPGRGRLSGVVEVDEAY